MRAFLFPDLLQRVLRVVCGYRVEWVMNITDIEDKIIHDSALGSAEWKPEMGSQTDNPNENAAKLALFYEREFLNDISTIGIRLHDFHAIPRATDFITEITDLVRNIVENGFGYESEGSVYFNLTEWRKSEKYGQLFTIDSENFRAGVRIDADEYDRDQVSDFVLWKSHKDGEPSWDFELNGKNLRGRPGWHIECSAMGHATLGLPFDIHTGGVDLRFPHHEDEIAQSKAGYGVETAMFWCHNEFLEVEGTKMSKSKGNFFTLRDLVNKGLDALDIRFAMMSAQYNSVFNFTFFGLESARKARLRIQDYIYDLHEKQSDTADKTNSYIIEFRREVFAELLNNLHTPKALERVFAYINAHPASSLNQETQNNLIAFFTELNGIFDVWEITARPEVHIEIPADVREYAEQRWQAKKDRNFVLADQLRAKVTELGFAILDTKDAYSIEKA
jgi:cysteinyl-tRNA synthetase